MVTRPARRKPLGRDKVRINLADLSHTSEGDFSGDRRADRPPLTTQFSRLGRLGGLNLSGNREGGPGRL